MIQQANPSIYQGLFSLTAGGPLTDCDPMNTGVCTVPGGIDQALGLALRRGSVPDAAATLDPVG